MQPRPFLIRAAGVTRSNRVPDGYKAAGVDIAEADAGLAQHRRPHHRDLAQDRASAPCNCRSAISPTSSISAASGSRLCTDGVGSKAIVAQMMRKYDTIGIDCVAMNVNDLLCVGARPVSMVDYIAIERADAAMLDGIAIGLAEGARQAGVSISGGEISQLPRHGARLRPGRHRGRHRAARPHHRRPRHRSPATASSASPATASTATALRWPGGCFFERAGVSVDHVFAELGASARRGAAAADLHLRAGDPRDPRSDRVGQGADPHHRRRLSEPAAGRRRDRLRARQSAAAAADFRPDRGAWRRRAGRDVRGLQHGDRLLRDRRRKRRRRGARDPGAPRPRRAGHRHAVADPTKSVYLPQQRLVGRGKRFRPE